MSIRREAEGGLGRARVPRGRQDEVYVERYAELREGTRVLEEAGEGG